MLLEEEEDDDISMTLPIIGAVVAGPAIAGVVSKFNNKLTRRRVGKLVRSYGSDQRSRKTRLFSRRPKRK